MQAEKITTPDPKKPVAKKVKIHLPNQRQVIADILKTLCKGGKTAQQIASQVHKKCGGSEKKPCHYDQRPR